MQSVKVNMVTENKFCHVCIRPCEYSLESPQHCDFIMSIHNIDSGDGITKIVLNYQLHFNGYKICWWNVNSGPAEPRYTLPLQTV